MGIAIKYRACNKQEKKMWQVTALQWDAADPCKFSKLELLSLDGEHTVRRVIGEACDIYDLLEYIGRKDCTGQEIFECDILAVDDSRGSIKYERGYFYFDDWCDGWTSIEDIYPERFARVLGNVYENPELLSEANNG